MQIGLVVGRSKTGIAPEMMVAAERLNQAEPRSGFGVNNLSDPKLVGLE